MTDTEAAKKHADETKKRLAAEREARSKASREAPTGVKPTPTQEENDLAASGVYLPEHEDDGSGADPNTAQTKQSEASKQPARAGYQTKAATPA